MRIFKLISPLRIRKSRGKDFIFNLNHYRNAHHYTLNNMKKKYKEFMATQIKELPILKPPVMVMFVLYTENAQKCDVSNVCSIHDKFFMDALVELGKLPDDNYEYVVETRYKFGSVDRDNPRMMVYIKDELDVKERTNV